MITPNLSDFRRLARKGNLVALAETIPADLETPVSCFLKLAKSEPRAFLLESAEQQEAIGRFSIIGYAPVTTLRFDGKTLSIENGYGKSKFKTTDFILDFIEARMNRLKLANPELVPGFSGGFVGYLSYENVEQFETISLKPQNELTIPHAVFFLSRSFILFDHYRKTLTVVYIAEIKNRRSVHHEYHKATRYLRRQISSLNRSLPVQRTLHPHRKISFKSNMSAGSFEQKVKKIKNYIRAGDCIQVVLSQRFEFPAQVEDFEIYRALRSLNPSPYMFYFRCDDLRLIGSSPEMLVKKIGRRVEVRPIAGTRPRGNNPSEDGTLELNLRNSRKEMAEHLMLVDLARNDLGRICEFESVRVADFARIEKFSHVMHLVSSVKGSLRRGKNSFDALKATFPAGTVAGAPKIRAMQIINELEPDRRGPYAGSLGYFGFNQDMDMCITIRTLVIKGRRAYLQAGAGIVQDSHPKKEYQETLNKAKALMNVLSGQGRRHASRHR